MSLVLNLCLNWPAQNVFKLQTLKTKKKYILIVFQFWYSFSSKLVFVVCKLCCFGFVAISDVFRNLVFGKSSIFHSLRNHELLVGGLFYQSTQNNLAFRARWEFFPTPQWGSWVFSNYIVDLNCVPKCPSGTVSSRFA